MTPGEAQTAERNSVIMCVCVLTFLIGGYTVGDHVSSCAPVGRIIPLEPKKKVTRPSETFGSSTVRGKVQEWYKPIKNHQNVR